MSNVMLFCLIQGDSPNNIFEVEIENNKYVNDLKEEIKKKNPDDFSILDVDKLWKVDIPLGEDGKPTDIKEFESEELDTTKKVIDYFPDNLSEKRVHIIVQRGLINVALFGLTGHGKSSIANMLIQG